LTFKVKCILTDFCCTALPSSLPHRQRALFTSRSILQNQFFVSIPCGTALFHRLRENASLTQCGEIDVGLIFVSPSANVRSWPKEGIRECPLPPESAQQTSWWMACQQYAIHGDRFTFSKDEPDPIQGNHSSLACALSSGAGG